MRNEGRSREPGRVAALTQSTSRNGRPVHSTQQSQHTLRVNTAVGPSSK